MSKPAAPQTDVVAQTSKFLNDLNGRDKLSKLIQYGSRFIAYQYLSANPKDETGLKWQGLFALTRDSRKLTRLFKTVNELNTLQGFFKPEASKDPFGQAVNIVGRVGWGAYWFWDNLVYLNKAKFYTNPNKIDLAYNGALGWTIGLLCSIILNARELALSFDSEASLLNKLRSTNSKLTGDSLKDKDAQEEVAKLRKDIDGLVNKRTKTALTLLGNIADFAVAANAIQLWEKTLGYKLNDGVLGFLGSFSATIGLYYRWREVNP